MEETFPTDPRRIQPQRGPAEASFDPLLLQRFESVIAKFGRFFKVHNNVLSVCDSAAIRNRTMRRQKNLSLAFLSAGRQLRLRRHAGPDAA